MKWLVSLIFIASFMVTFDHADSAKILCVSPTASKSHVLGLQALLKELANRGHEVTMVSAFPLSKPRKNYRDVYVPIEDAFGALMNDFMKGGSRNLLKILPNVSTSAMESANFALNTPQFRKLATEETFDLAIVGFFFNSFVLGVGALFKCPTILYFSAAPSALINFVGNPTEVAAVPHLLLGKRNPMTFLERVANTLLNGVETVMVKYIDRKMLTYYENNFPAAKGFPSYGEVTRNVSLVMTNSYFTQAVVRPYLPNMVEVGGLQIKSKPDPLPTDLQAYLDGATSGAVFISFGSNLRSSNLRQDKFDAIIATILKFKHLRFIWKWDTDTMPNKPDNVFIGKWLPQDDILGHRNLKLFLTHGGLGSITESMYHGVPIVGIPMFGDQDHNIAQVLQEGWGVAVHFDVLTEPLLSAAIQEVMSNPRYASEIDKIATLFKDRPMGPLETAAFWVEYVVRHRGAPHLHYQGADLNLFQVALLDVYAFLAVVAYIVAKILLLALRKVKHFCLGKPTANIPIDSKKKRK